MSALGTTSVKRFTALFLLLLLLMDQDYCVDGKHFKEVLKKVWKKKLHKVVKKKFKKLRAIPVPIIFPMGVVRSGIGTSQRERVARGDERGLTRELGGTR